MYVIVQTPTHQQVVRMLWSSALTWARECSVAIIVTQSTCDSLSSAHDEHNFYFLSAVVVRVALLQRVEINEVSTDGCFLSI